MRRFERATLATMLVLVMCASVFGQSLTSAESPIPGEAWLVIGVDNMDGFDKKIQSVSTKAMYPIPMAPIAMMRMQMGFASGVKTDGSLYAVAIPPLPPSPDMIFDQVAFLVPVTDFEELTAMMELKDAGDGVSSFDMMGEPFFIGKRGDYAVLAPTLEIAKGIITSTKPLKDKVSAAMAKEMKTADLFAWMEAAPVAEHPMVLGLAAMSGGQNPLQDAESLLLALSLSNTNIELNIVQKAIPDSETAKINAAMAATDDSLLVGIPDEPFVLAGGYTATKESAEIGVEQFKKVCAQPNMMMFWSQVKADMNKVQPFLNLCFEMFQSSRGVSFGVTLPQDKDGGFLAMTKVVAFEGDSKDLMEKVSKMIDMIKGGLIMEPEMKKILDTIEYKKDAEEIDGAKVNQLVVDFNKIPNVDQNWKNDTRKIMEALFGKDGCMIRIGVISDTKILVTLGGGKERFSSVSKLAKSGRGPIDRNKGIKASSRPFPKKLAGEGFLSCSGILDLWKKMGETDERFKMELPMEPPADLPPLAAAATPFDETGVKYCVVIPVEVISSGMQIYQAMMMGGMPADTDATPQPAPSVN